MASSPDSGRASVLGMAALMTYPDPHYDEDDTCQCPDHVAMREAREADEAENEPYASRLLRRVLGGF